MKIRLWSIIISLLVFAFACKNTENDTEELSQKSEIEITQISKNDSIIGKAIEDSLLNQGLVNIQDDTSNIMVDLKYSTTDNFFKKDVYGTFSNAYLQKKANEGLKKAQSFLKQINPNFTLIVYDAARPLHIQQVLWDALDSIPPVKRKDFVADPAQGSIHNYGCAVDLSIFDIETKKPLDMGTSYDFFGPLAYPKFEQKMLSNGQLTEKAFENRKLLRKIMAYGGFEPITSEWWHFNFYSRERAKSLFSIIK
jgi:zinc D-Ala-D-Ala dipeptidase